MSPFLRISLLSTFMGLLVGCGGDSDNSQVTSASFTLYQDIGYSLEVNPSRAETASETRFSYQTSMDTITTKSGIISTTPVTLVGTTTAAVQSYTLTSTKLLITPAAATATATYPSHFLTNINANNFSVTPFNTDNVTNKAILTLRYQTVKFDNQLIADVIADDYFDDDPNLAKLKASGLKMPTGSLGVYLTGYTTQEATIEFDESSSRYSSIASWKLMHAGQSFDDFVWGGYGVSCLSASQQCVVSYNGQVYAADYLPAETVNFTEAPSYYYQYNKTAADAISAAIKTYFTSPTIIKK
ncbi:hypothetical protein [Agitococcus lubricus]|uniref:Uncharacterized protein n=1 Tax=Agitococcus lubricus TaxID=1077255 RepID=A0A2T5J2B7_9GAMM|nr:hypothetical protein [Agitococcus lubricus]PTQ90659.1 hypothetical protein C8N29_10259 [Agitococcus lubricus]